MSAAEHVCARVLSHPRIRHAFFTRRGGVSTGVYSSLNGGAGSNDDPARVADNRARMAKAIGVEASRLAVPFQVHSAEALAVEAPFSTEARPRCDGLVTAKAELGIGVTGADCGILLFAEPEAGVIGAAHAGWRGALSGIIEATVDAMANQGAALRRIRAALGPCIRQPSYEVGPEFRTLFLDRDPKSEGFFVPAGRDGHAMFDLAGYIGMRLARAGVEHYEDLALDTYADDERFFSFRRSTHRQEPDYGRLVAAIALFDPP